MKWLHANSKRNESLLENTGSLYVSSSLEVKGGTTSLEVKGGTTSLEAKGELHH